MAVPTVDEALQKLEQAANAGDRRIAPRPSHRARPRDAANAAVAR